VAIGLVLGLASSVTASHLTFWPTLAIVVAAGLVIRLSIQLVMWVRTRRSVVEPAAAHDVEDD
jgi:hypothetical protein